MKIDIKLSGLLGAGLLYSIFFLLGYTASWRVGSQWVLQAGLLWGWVLYLTWKRSDLNRVSIDAPLLKKLGWANRLTLLRGYLIALTGGFLFQPDISGFISWIPGLLYGVAAILDRLDGFVARKSKQTTLLGAELDTAFDAMGLIIAPLLAVGMGKIHWSYLLLSIAFYIFQWGIYWRRKQGLAVYSLMPSQLRRTLAGFQMGFVALALLPWFQASQTIICGFAFLIPVLLGFAVDWLVVSGRINAESLKTQYFFEWLSRTSRAGFQPALRAFLCIGVLFTVHDMELFSTSSQLKIIPVVAFIFGVSLVLLGSAGRIGALIILLLLGSYSIAMSALNITVLCASVWLLLLGTGRFSLWQWDDVWVNRQDGASA